MSKTSQESEKENKWSKLTGWFLKTISDIVKSTIAKTLALIILGSAILKETLEWISGLSIKEIMTYPLTPRIIPISPLSILLATLFAFALLFLGHKFRDIKKGKVRYIDYARFIWKVQRIKNKYVLKPLCPIHCSELQHLHVRYVAPEYAYKCPSCNKEIGTDIIRVKKHDLENQINNFGISHFKEHFVNIKKECPPPSEDSTP